MAGIREVSEALEGAVSTRERRVRDAMVAAPPRSDACAHGAEAAEALARPRCARCSSTTTEARRRRDAEDARARGRRGRARPRDDALGAIAEAALSRSTPDMPLDEAFRLLEERDFERVPVVEANGGLVGVLSRGVVQRRLAEDESPEDGRRRRRAGAGRSAAGVGAGRRRALFGLRQLGGRERGAVQEVALTRLEPVEAVGAQHLADDHDAGDDHRRALRLEAGQSLARSSSGSAASRSSQRSTVAERDAVAVHALGVVLVAAELERRERRHGAGHADAARLGSAAVGRTRAVRSSGRDVVAEPLGEPHAADVEAGRVAAVDGELRRAAADVEQQRAGRQRAAGGDAADRSAPPPRRRSGAACEAVAPLDLAEERLAVLGVAHGARGDEPGRSRRAPRAPAGSR